MTLLRVVVAAVTVWDPCPATLLLVSPWSHALRHGNMTLHMVLVAGHNLGPKDSTQGSTLGSIFGISVTLCMLFGTKDSTWDPCDFA